jgi:replicative DNA helicase
MPSKYDNPVCQACIEAHLKKYAGYVDQDGRVYKNFSVPCDGIPEEYIPREIAVQLTKEELEEAKTLYDPVEWAKKNIVKADGTPWEARWYQALMLRCTSSRKVARIGRRCGKCLASGTQVMTPLGPTPIEDLRPGDMVYGFDQASGQVFPTPVLEVHDQGLQQTTVLENHGREVARCTPVHRWHTRHSTTGRSGVLRVEQFTRDTMITRKFVDIPMGQTKEPHAYAIGALLGDGCSCEPGYKLYVSSEEEAIPSKIASVLSTSYYKTSSENYTWVIGESGTREAETRCNYYDLWCKNKHAHEKTCDLNVLKTWDRRSLLSFLAGLLDTDGTVGIYGNTLSIRLSIQALPVIMAAQWLLLALFQCNASVYIDDRDRYKNGPVYGLSVRSNLHARRILRQLAPHMVSHKGWRTSYEELAEHNEKPDYYGVTNSDQLKTERCWDLSIGTKDNLYLLANGLVTHNTDTIAVDVLHYATTSQMKRVLIIAPFKAQTEEIITRIRDFVYNSKQLSQAIDRDVSSPFYEILLRNGSKIRGFTSGTKTGGEAANVRGQDADRIYIDEADQLCDKDLAAISPILQTHPNVRMWVSSTPTGRRSHFWRWCTRSPLYKEFFHSSEVLPFWNETLAGQPLPFKENIRTEYVGRQDDWVHEVMAEFGEQTVGVFQNAFVDAASEDYKYTDMKYDPDTIYSIGVDWNTEAGTEIAVTGFRNGLWRIVECINVPKQQWTQLKGIDAILRLNEKWHPQWVYVDAGAGSTNIEVIQKFSREEAARNPLSPAANLYKIVKPYDFWSKVDAYDPLTKQPIKKHSKPFIVENTARRFEEGNIRISDHDTILKNQLGSYIIKNRSESGIPIYGLMEEKLGDHRLTAVMLSLISYKLEMSDFGKPTHSSRISISTGLGLGVPETNKSQQDRLVDKGSRLPQSRDRMDNLILGDQPGVPGMTGTFRVATNRPGWDSDTEHKFKLQYERRQARKRLLYRRTKPERGNI